MGQEFNTILAKLSLMGHEREMATSVRRLALGAVKALGGPAAKARAVMEGIAEVEAIVQAEAASWLEPLDIARGASGAFDVFDLRVWLWLSEKAGVPFVPAREILTLEEAEIEAIGRKIAIPEGVVARIARSLARLYPYASRNAGLGDGAEGAIEPEAVMEKLFAAMDGVEEGWIVRSHLCGPSLLKAMAGAGTVEDGESSAKFEQGLEVGAGWVRHGNRRRVDATDHRLIETFAKGHKPRLTYLARPWMKAARYKEGPDPHRHGTVFAGRGKWPCEWRVYVERGEAIGVSAYYAWAGEATPTDARMALEAMALAQKIVDEAQRRRLVGRFMDVEITRRQIDPDTADPSWTSLLARFPRDQISCTLDFIEAEGQGLTLLEGGPGNTPIGGGHPCGFAGVDMRNGVPGPNATRGVALRLMEHVSLGDPGTWRDGDRSGRIFSLEEARALSRQ